MASFIKVERALYNLRNETKGAKDVKSTIATEKLTRTTRDFLRPSSFCVSLIGLLASKVFHGCLLPRR
jgi:hypothetical protein